MYKSTTRSSHETGLEIGDDIPNLKFFDFNREQVIFKGNCIFVFVSNYCAHCIDLLPELQGISDAGNSKLILFSTGDISDNEEMHKYFNWNFQVVQLNEDEMEKYFGVVTLPFCMIINKNQVVKKGVIYNMDDYKYMSDGHR
ncbi:TlpA family protein disulfide reductase [Rossellomorea arthrocnemi]|uniref:TlpA family protein disulfide reductase n=1 Tax=Rossellomorea arthrocnemi TaxID=2769542 RepID=UPI00191AD95C|nr:alkyl hydroperoxide reductase [Rossellomorea arthrocnemi]